MFLCVSLNPAVDKRLRLERLLHGCVNRVTEVTPAPGGKAAHVAMVLRTLGADPLWLGFAGGSTGAALVEGLQRWSLRVDAVPVAGSTRMNLELIDKDGVVTEILEPGQPVVAGEIERLRDRYECVLRDSGEKAMAILSGSLPQNVPPDFYATLIELAHKCGCRAFLDTSGEPLRCALEARPDFVKPNQEEAEWLTGRKISSRYSAGEALSAILDKGACSGAISLGGAGLVWRSVKEPKALFARVPELNAKSTVGSGDATLAGFAFAHGQGLPSADALRLAAACGAANCLADSPARARLKDIHRLINEIQVGNLE